MINQPTCVFIMIHYITCQLTWSTTAKKTKRPLQSNDRQDSVNNSWFTNDPIYTELCAIMIHKLPTNEPWETNHQSFYANEQLNLLPILDLTTTDHMPQNPTMVAKEPMRCPRVERSWDPIRCTSWRSRRCGEPPWVDRVHQGIRLCSAQCSLGPWLVAPELRWLK